MINAPLRKVLETVHDPKLMDVLECGHRWLWNTGDKYGWGGSYPAKRRRCFQCAAQPNIKPTGAPSVTPDLEKS